MFNEADIARERKKLEAKKKLATLFRIASPDAIAFNFFSYPSPNCLGIDFST